VRILLVLDPSDATMAIRNALSLRGHRVTEVSQPTPADIGEAFTSAELIVVDSEIALRLELVERLAVESPGIAFVLVGRTRRALHPDVIEELDRPITLDRLLGIVDELADVLDGERFREPIDLVNYETLFAGDSPHIRDLVRRVRLVARSEAPVWIFGDDGSGRTIIARAIHDRSIRRAHPFVAINALAHPDEDLCRLLFDGPDAAVTRAAEGTVFVDRIAAAGPVTQRQLVHYLETRHREATSTRLIVAIQRDLDGPELFVAPELYYRLKVLEVEIPRLEERVRDLEQIVGRMLERMTSTGKTPMLAADTMRLLEGYSFPGNVTELAHALMHAFVLARGAVIEPEHLPASIRRANRVFDATDPATERELEVLEVVAKRFERDYLLRVLRTVDGNRGRAATILGLSRKGLWGKLKAHGISDDDIDRDENAS
jgi:two-component system response regulator AtoC